MKKEIEDLAIFGGSCAFDKSLYVGMPNEVDKAKFMNSVKDILDRKWFTNNGEYVQRFEKKIANYTGVKHCIAVCNGTAGLQLAYKALGLKGEVIVPSMTFIATVHALQWQGIKPVFCDIDLNSCTIDPYKIEKLITPNTTGIIGVHLWGKVCDVDALTKIAKKHKLKLVFDAAHAFGNSYKSKRVGNFGDAEIFSFHATKFINTFEGGAVLTNNEKLAEKIRLMRNFGFCEYDKTSQIGINAKMSEVCAAMGLAGLEKMEKIIDHNYQNYIYYQQELSKINGIRLIHFDKKEKYNYQYIVIDVSEEDAHISRDQLMKILHAENIIARRYFYPGCHNMEPYKSLFPDAGLFLPVTEEKAKAVLSLPTGLNISKKDIKRICEIIKFSVENAEKIKAKGAKK